MRQHGDDADEKDLPQSDGTLVTVTEADYQEILHLSEEEIERRAGSDIDSLGHWED